MAYDWNGYSHQTLYDMVHGKFNVLDMGDVELNGVGGAEGAGTHAEFWNGVANKVAEFQQRLESALAASKGSWEGAAADSMHSGVTPLGQWAGNAHQAGVATKTSAEGYTEAFSRAKTSMPEPVKVNTTVHPTFTGIPSGFTDLVDAQQDQDPQEVRAQQAKAQAVTVMQGYESGATASRDSMGSFPTPPEITTAVQDITKPVTPIGPHQRTPSDEPTGPGGGGQTNGPDHVGQTTGPVNRRRIPARTIRAWSRRARPHPAPDPGSLRSNRFRPASHPPRTRRAKAGRRNPSPNRVAPAPRAPANRATAKPEASGRVVPVSRTNSAHVAPVARTLASHPAAAGAQAPCRWKRPNGCPGAADSHRARGPAVQEWAA